MPTQPGKLYISFWNLCLENLPIGKVTHNCIEPGYAQLCIEQARKDSMLLCVTDIDLLAPYRQDDRERYEALCAALKARFSIDLSLDDFLPGHEEGGQTIYAPIPLNCVTLRPRDKLLVITCAYTLADERKKGDFIFKLTHDTLEFHMIEVTQEDLPKAEASPPDAKALLDPTPIAQAELMANWDEMLDRVEAGEVFKIIRGGKPPVCLVPARDHDFYRRLLVCGELVAEAQMLGLGYERRDWMRLQESTAAAVWDNDTDAGYDEAHRQSRLAAGHPDEDASLEFIEDASDTGDAP